MVKVYHKKLVLSTIKVPITCILLLITNGGVKILDILNKISELLKKQNLKQRDLTDYLGLSKNAFTNWKGGFSQSYQKYLPQIAEFLGVGVDYLISNEETQKKNDILADAILNMRTNPNMFKVVMNLQYLNDEQLLFVNSVVTSMKGRSDL